MAGLDGAQVTREDQGNVAVLLLAAPPRFQPGAALWQDLAAAVGRALADPHIAVVLIRAAGRGFPVWTEGANPGAGAARQALSDLCRLVETAEKPVVVALHGLAVGPVLELALAAPARIADAGARIGLPDVTLGLLPGAGGTQRLPRLIGAEQALRLLLTGRGISAAEALALGLLDRVVEEALPDAALAMARDLAGRRLTATRDRRDGLRDGLVYQRAVAAARSRLEGSRLPAPGRIVDCVEAAQLLPFEQGLVYEATAFEDLCATPEAAALRHVQLAERLAARLPPAAVVPGVQARPLRRVGFLGAAAADLTLPVLAAGGEVVLVDPHRPQLVQALEKIAALQEKSVAEGKLSPERREADWARLGSALGAAALADCDAVLVTDAALMAEVAEATSPGCLLAFAGRGAISAHGRAADMLGFRAGGGRLAEIVAGPETSGGALLTARALAQMLGKTVLFSRAPGGVGGRIMGAGRAAVAHLVQQGEAEDHIAGALAGFGLAALAPVGAVLRGAVPQRTAERILQRVLSAMANEGARILGAGLLRCPAEVDFALIAGQGFPRGQGGVMHWADRRGLLILRRDLQEWQEEAPEIWGLAPLISDLVATGRRLADLDDAVSG
ncbi:hypothetical protein GCM10011452_00710 [Gemmobacter lanyuensis]|uniref:3-hydroxyacyl-CoA dehydrogenase n=1 Tax=Gemmobacter lanyuensis TaxID=1054497 RepID=A0A918IMB0_9RHOB|nr:enoyl-CoA hydratase-related protein [Gemmobacter lanyuensis]GGW21220.1 hypothetical protein GCM10011452_00710 [Gemmobacter lanyuensis]